MLSSKSSLSCQQRPRAVSQPLGLKHVNRLVVRYKDDKQDMNDVKTPRDLRERREAEESVIRKQEEDMARKLQNEILSKQGPVGKSISSSTYQPTAPHGTGEDDIGIKTNPLIPAFTRRRELFAGRIAIVGFTAACFWEWYFPSHPNAILQVTGFAQAVGLPVDPSQVALLLWGLVVYNTVAALAPASPTWSYENLSDVAKRAPVRGPPANWVSPLNYKSFFGVTDWGFTKPNELFHGRLAMLGFAGVLLQQLRLGGYMGPGALAQVASLLNVPADETFYASVPGFFLGWAIAAAAYAYVRGQTGIMEDRKLY